MSGLYNFPSETPCQRFVKDLLGCWDTEAGKGKFPTMLPFTYGAEFKAEKVPVKTKAPFVHTSLRSWPSNKKNEIGMHYENGFLRCVGPDDLEWNIAHNFGVTEVAKGKIKETVSSGGLFGSDTVRAAVLESTSVGNAGVVTGTKRVMEVNAARGTLLDVFYMSTTDVPNITEHLRTEYTKKN